MVCECVKWKENILHGVFCFAGRTRIASNWSKYKWYTRNAIHRLHHHQITRICTHSGSKRIYPFFSHRFHIVRTGLVSFVAIEMCVVEEMQKQHGNTRDVRSTHPVLLTVHIPFMFVLDKRIATRLSRVRILDKYNFLDRSVHFELSPQL